MTVRKTVNPKQDLKNTLSEGEKGSAPPLCAAKRRKPLSVIKKHTLNEIKIKKQTLSPVGRRIDLA
jgi:hypothetical protein